MKARCTILLFLLAVLLTPTRGRADDGAQAEIPNRLIDAEGFLRDTKEAHQLRMSRRITQEQFIEMAKDPNTIILDARTPARYTQLHIAGSKSLSFTEFTEETLRATIPSKQTRILIYCNNNIENSSMAFPAKFRAASLNLSTFPALYTYGYKNVYELGPVVDPATSKIRFEGTLTGKPGSGSF